MEAINTAERKFIFTTDNLVLLIIFDNSETNFENEQMLYTSIYTIK